MPSDSIPILNLDAFVFKSRADAPKNGTFEMLFQREISTLGLILHAFIIIVSCTPYPSRYEDPKQNMPLICETEWHLLQTCFSILRYSFL